MIHSGYPKESFNSLRQQILDGIRPTLADLDCNAQACGYTDFKEMWRKNRFDGDPTWENLQTLIDINTFNIHLPSNQVLWMSRYYPYVFKGTTYQSDNYREFALTKKAKEILTASNVALPLNFEATFKGVNETPTLSVLNTLHSLLDKERILDAIESAKLKNASNYVSRFRQSEQQDWLQLSFPKYCRQFSLEHYLKDLNVILATTADCGMRISECTDLPTIKETSDIESSLKITASKVKEHIIDDSIKKGFDALLDDVPLEKCLEQESIWEDSDKTSSDVLGYYQPRTSHIVIFVDRILRLHSPQLVYQETLLHEYIHALLDWRTRMSLKEPDKERLELRDIEETINNLIVLYLYSRTDEQTFKKVQYMMVYQPFYYRIAVKMYDRLITTGTNIEDALRRYAIELITLAPKK